MGFNTGATAKTLTLTGTNTGNNTIAAVIGDLTLATSLTKTGIGAWVLSGANTNTGATTISGGGKLVLNYSTQDNSKLANAAALTLSNGAGDITLRGGSHLEAVGSLSFSTGGGHTSITREVGSTAKLALGAITRGQGGSVTMSLAEDGLATTSASVSNGILTGGIIVGSNWAKLDGSNNIVALTSGDYTALTSAATTATLNYQLTGTLSRGAALINSLRITGSGTDDVLTITAGNLSASQVSVAGNTYGGGASGGFLYTGGGNNNYTITGAGNLGAQNGNQEVIIHTLTGTLTVDMILAMGNTNGTLTKSGAGTLVLTKNNTYTAATYVNQGALRLQHANAAGTATNTLGAGIVVANNATLELANNVAIGAEALTITGTGISNGGALRSVSTNTTSTSYAGAVTIGAGGARINTDGTAPLTLSGGVVTSLFNDVTFGGAGSTTVSTAAISGAGGLIKDGAGTTTLSFANTYTGTTTVSAGTLTMATNLIASSSGIFIGNGATLENTGAANFVIPANVNVTGTGATGFMAINPLNTAVGFILSGNSTISNNAGGSLSVSRLDVRGTGNIVSAGTLLLGVSNSNRGLLVGNTVNSDFTINTGATVTSSGGTADILGNGNGITGTLIIAGGTYNANNALSLGNAASNGNGTLTLNTGSATINSLNFNSNATHNSIVNLNGGTLTLNAITYTATATNRVFNFDGGQLVAGGGLTFANLTTNVKNGGAKINTNGFNSTISSNLVNFGGTSTGGLTKSGIGTLTLSGSNNYAGPTNVNGGTLLVNNTTGSGTGTGAVTVNAATLGGTGSIGGAVTVNSGGTLAPGASIESLAAGALTLNNGSTFAYELDTVSINGDLLKVNGALDINATSTLSLADLSASTALLAGIKLTLINYSGAWNTGTFTSFADDATFVLGLNTWQINYNDITGGTNFSGEQTLANFVTITVVPEPTSLTMLGLGAMGLLKRRRRSSLAKAAV